jgi:RHS repeat-associated protein
MNITSKTLMTMAAAMVITLTGWAKTLPGIAPLSPEKLAKWRAEEMLANAPKAAAKSDLVFYTGKPYDADLKAYVFPFRNYSPDLCRWTVADPSGFPDGANNYFYAPTPNMGCDPLGLLKVNFIDLATNNQVGNNQIPAVVETEMTGGAFSARARYLLVAPDTYELNVYMYIHIQKDLKEIKDYKIGDRFDYITHWANFSGGISGGVAGGAGIIKSAAIAHETGHANAYNTSVRSDIESFCANIGSTAANAISAQNKHEELFNSFGHLEASSLKSNNGYINAMSYGDKNMRLVQISKTPVLPSGEKTTWELVAE